MSVLAGLEALIQERRGHEAAIKKIDEELERVRLALGMPPPRRALKPSEQHHGPYVSTNGRGAQKILDALIEKAPQTLSMLVKHTTLNRLYINRICNSLIQSQRLYGQRGEGVGRPMWYALEKWTVGSAGDADDELGSIPLVTTVGDLTSAVTDTNPSADTFSDALPISGTTNGTTGSCD